MAYKATGIVTNYNHNSTECKVQLKTDITFKEKNLLEKEDDDNIKMVSPDDMYSVSIALINIIGEMALKGSKGTFTIEDNKIIAVEISNVQ